MSTILADSTLGGIGGYANANIASGLADVSMSPGAPPYAYTAVESVAVVTLVNALPVSASPRVLNCDPTSSYFDDYYNRIHVVPSSIAFGSIIASSTRDLVVWNSYLDPKVFSDINVPADLGVSVNPPAGVSIPQTFNALQQWTFSVVADLIGPPTFDSAFEFTVSGRTISVPVSGRRLVVFPFAPNWNSPVDESFEWNSWVLTAGDGSEQTGSNWGNQPRRHFSYTVLLKGLQLQKFENLLFGWQHRAFGLPVWVDKTKTTASIAPGSTAVPCDTSLRSFVADGFGVLYLDDDNFEAFAIQSVSAGSITAALPTQRAWPAGTRVYPVIPALLNQTTSGGYQVDNLAVVPVSFDCDPQQTPGNTATTATVPQYQGEELYMLRANWASPLSFQVNSARRTLDYRTGANSTYSTQGFSKTTRKHTWNLTGRQSSADFRAFIGRREGIAIPVYMPTGNTDFTVVSPALVDTAYLDVSPNDYDLFVGAHPARRDLAILLRNGTYFVRRITDAQMSGSVLRLTLDATFPQNIDPSQMKRVSLVGFYRLESNSVSIRWLTDEVGTAEANLVTKRTP